MIERYIKILVNILIDNLMFIQELAGGLYDNKLPEGKRHQVSDNERIIC